MRHYTGQEFEDEVRTICRNLFSNSIGQGSAKVDGRERDGVFWNGDFFTIVEATTEKKKDKADIDGKKTHELVNKKRTEGFMAKGIVVTLHEPTADQREALKKYQRTTKIISFDELRSQLFDTNEYLRNRSNKPFGSVYDHAAHSFEVPREDFVEPTILSPIDSAQVNLEELISKITKGTRLIVTAEYGIGKSMLLREVFFRLVKEFSNKNTLRCPVVINLREHMGQSDPVELLERHARNNAIEPRRLVAAFNAGYVDLIIDGFDELSTRGWTGDHRKLREFKRSTHAVVKNLIKSTPKKSSVVISGRAAYFDSEKEMREALGAGSGVFEHLTVQPFDSEQASEFLRKKGYHDPLPQWLPTRPLFLSYLINKDLIQDVVRVSSDGSFPEGVAWVSLLAMIATRESDQSEGVDQDSILKFWGLLATKARQDSNLQKSFSPTEIDETFYQATGNTVTEDERRLLLRLPGLGISSDDPSRRVFIDEDFLNASSASLLLSHIKFPYGEDSYHSELRSIERQLNLVGVHVLCAGLESDRVSTGALQACLARELESKNYGLAYDIFSSLLYLDSSQLVSHSMSIRFEGVDIQELDLCPEFWTSLNISFRSCLVENLVLPPDGDLPENVSFVDCLLGNIEGRASLRELPSDQFIGCEVDKFSNSYSVNNNILDSELPLGVRVLVVTLRKVYAQAGISRLESALLRGLDHRARMVAPDVIERLLKNNFLLRSGRQGKTIYIGTRDKRKEALAIIQSPASCSAVILDECRSLY